MSAGAALVLQYYCNNEVLTTWLFDRYLAHWQLRTVSGRGTSACCCAM